MYPLSTVELVKELDRQGLNKSAIARTTGVSRAAIRSWLDGTIPGVGMAARTSPSRCRRCDALDEPFPHLTDAAYSYLLGMYLGDGCLSNGRRGVKHLRISLDTAYPIIIEECVSAVSLVAPMNSVSVVSRQGNVVDVSSWSKHWPCFFPQHGPGKKHERPIELEGWQRNILDRWPWRFLRGLIHSDGSRFLNPSIHPNKTYWYTRYLFSNESKDILGLFLEYCEKVGVDARHSKTCEASVAKRRAVAQMDQHIGPKR
jgi:hypothetical protein